MSKKATKDKLVKLQANKSNDPRRVTCVQCGKSFMPSQMDIDHITPISKGGSDAIVNLQLLCQSCNRSKGNSLKKASRHSKRNK